MQAEFWLEKWEKPKHGWTQDKVNSRLMRHWSSLGLVAGAPVLVPLCGDSIDLDWLIASGHEVCGCDLSENAFNNWGQRHGLTLEQAESVAASSSKRWQVAGSWPPEKLLVEDQVGTSESQAKDQLRPHLVSGDFLTLSASDLPFVPQAVYDRAALVALPAEMRRLYAAKLAELLPVGAKVFLITCVYDQQKMKGPPFSVSDEEVAGLYDEHFKIECITRSGGPEILGDLAERGLDTLDESVFCLTKN